MTWWAEPSLTSWLAAGYLGLLTLLWVGLTAGTHRWGERWSLPRPDEGSAPDDEVMVSLCIPARNERLNIGAAVRAALASRWGSFELIVVDDRSEDGTAEAAIEAAAGDPRLRVVEGTEPPAGWAGKPWACARAAGEARGDVLIFVDADVVLDPLAVVALVSGMRESQAALASAFGSWELVGFWERAVVPTVGWLIRGAVDLDAVNDPGRQPAFANGQVIAVDRRAYDALGGHGVVRDQVLEDVRLAEAFKRRGHRLALWVAPWLFRARLYRSLRDIVGGYSKNLYEGMGRRPAMGLGAILFIGVGTLLPWLGLGASLWARLGLGWSIPGGLWICWVAVVCALQVAFRWRIERRDGRRGWIAWIHPIANLVLVWILLRSVFGVRARWKGRSFVDGRAD